jgi:DNA-3-methyladenine glycosylase
LGKKLIRVIDGVKREYPITEVEVYLGEEDAACHAAKGRTERTEVMYANGGVIYVYFIYGMYWMLNFVTGKENHPQAILIRAVENINGPGRVGKALHLDKSFYGENLSTSNRIWIEDNDQTVTYTTTPRIGINYAPEEWKNKLWRFILK